MDEAKEGKKKEVEKRRKVCRRGAQLGHFRGRDKIL